jgi:hypothetical protein
LRKLIAAAAFAATMAMAPAYAGIIDFANEADTNGERGVASGSTIIIDGVNMRLSGTQGLDINQPFAASPYFDSGDAGLGVCKVLTGSAQCSPSSDDNVTLGEALKIEFLSDDGTMSVSRNILGLAFDDGGHSPLGLGNDGLIRIVTDTSDMAALFSVFIAMAAGADAFFQNVSTIEFFYNNQQFYVNALDVSEIPIPGALPLLLSGLAGLGFAGRRRKSKA